MEQTRGGGITPCLPWPQLGGAGEGRFWELHPTHLQLALPLSSVALFASGQPLALSQPPLASLFLTC